MKLPGFVLAAAAMSAACGTQPSAPPPALWTETSAAVDVSCTAMLGYMRFRATRDQLSAAQIALLSKLRVIDVAPAACGGDGVSCLVAITQADGSIARYGSAGGDPGCDNATQVVTWSSFQPFEDTITCRWNPGATALPPDARCFHGFLQAPGETITIPVAVDTAVRPYHLELDGCAAAVGGAGETLDVLTPDAAATLVSALPAADPGADGACLRLDYAFAQPGTYPVAVTNGTIGHQVAYVRYY